MSSSLPSGFSNRQSLFWRLQVIGWMGTLVLSVGMSVYLPMKGVLVLAVLRAVFGFLVTSFLLRPLLQRLRRCGLALKWQGVLASVVGVGLLGFADSWVMGGISRLVGGSSLLQPEVAQFLSLSAVIRSVLYGFWAVLYFGMHYWLDTQQQQLHAARMEAALRVGELQMLRSQVNPHFLFNALSSILAAADHPPATRQITLALADYLRFSLQQRGDTDCFGVEMSALESYLKVEMSRFEDDFEYSLDIDPASLHLVVPVALVQPLLENAIKYGQQSAIRPLRVRVVAVVKDERLNLSVVNSGSWVPSGREGSTGVGLANLQRRLELIYSGGASLSWHSSEGEVTVFVSLPLMSTSLTTALA